MKYFFIIILLMVYVSCQFIVSGSYSDSEDYRLNISREELISKINDFKNENPEYKVMTTFEDGKKGELKDRMDAENTFYSIWFYYTEQKTTLFCVINMSGKIPSKPAIIQLVSKTKSKNFGSWKDINTEQLSKEENARIKKIFENKILNNLGEWTHE